MLSPAIGKCKLSGRFVSSQPPFAASFGRQCCFGSRCLRHSRHGRLDASIILLIWLSENVGFFATTFSRHGRLDASIILLIWLSEKVDQTKTIKTLFLVQACLHQLEVTIAFCQKRLFVSPPFLLPTALRAKEKKNRNHSLVYSREIFQLVAESQSSC